MGMRAQHDEATAAMAATPVSKPRGQVGIANDHALKARVAIAIDAMVVAVIYLLKCKAGMRMWNLTESTRTRRNAPKQFKRFRICSCSMGPSLPSAPMLTWF